MGANNGSINFGNIPVGSGSGGGVTASEGLITVGNDVQLGSPVFVGTMVTNMRTVEMQPASPSGIAFGQTGYSGNRFELRMDALPFVFTKTTLPSGQATKFIFDYDSLIIQGTGTPKIRSYGNSNPALPPSSQFQWEIDFKSTSQPVSGNDVWFENKVAIGDQSGFTFAVNNADGCFSFVVNTGETLGSFINESLGQYTAGLWLPGGNGNGGIIMGNSYNSILCFDVNTLSTVLRNAGSGFDYQAELKMEASTGEITLRQGARLGVGNDLFTLSAPVSASSSLDTTKYVPVTIGGVSYKLALIT